MSTDNSISVSADAMAHSLRVCSFLRDQIHHNNGWMAFSEWMHHALYAPGLGYYAAGNIKLASTDTGDTEISGDFVTAPQLTPLFGETLARQVAQILEHSQSNQVLEFGAGTGALGDAVLTSLESLGVQAQYQILEVSGDLRSRQQARLARWGDRVIWRNEAPATFAGCVLANEVLDAMPVDIFVWSPVSDRNDTLTVLRAGVSLAESEASLNKPLESNAHAPKPPFVWDYRASDQHFAELVASRCAPMPGYQSEVNLQAEAWVKSMGGWLEKGAAILIDYGFPRAEYYHPQRHRGTLMCHIQHRAHDDPFLAPGIQDITAHVDFTAIADAATAGGLDVLGYTSQARFLFNTGLIELMMARQAKGELSAQARTLMNTAVQKLISEAEMGELFKVIVIGREIEQPLIGFNRGDRRHQL